MNQPPRAGRVVAFCLATGQHPTYLMRAPELDQSCRPGQLSGHLQSVLATKSTTPRAPITLSERHKKLRIFLPIQGSTV